MQGKSKIRLHQQLNTTYIPTFLHISQIILVYFSRIFSITSAILFTAIFVITCVMLHQIDLRNVYFDAPGPIYPLHHCLLAIFSFYIFWLLLFVGDLIIKLFNTHPLILKINEVERTVLKGFVGLSILQLVGIFLGFTSLLYDWLVISIFTVIVFYSWTDLVSTIPRLFNFFIKKNYHLIDLILIGILLYVIAYIFFAKVVFPTFDWDTIMHYNEYFMESIRLHHLYPNNVWYHFFYSKGAGSFLIGILLSDQYGHKVVTFISVMLASLAFFSLLSFNKSRTFKLIFLIAYLGVFVTNDWYIFDKQHVMLSCLLLGLLWVSLVDRSIPELKKIVYAATIFLICAIVFFSPTTSGVLLPLYFFYSLIYKLSNKSEKAIHYASLFIFTLFILIVVLATNYIYTGMLEINPITPFFYVANKKTMSQWTSPYMVIWLVEAFPIKHSSFAFHSLFNVTRILKGIIQYLHIKEFKWLLSPDHLVFAVIMFYICCDHFYPLQNRNVHKKLRNAIAITLIIALLVSATMNQPISTARLFIFTTPLLLLLLASLLTIIMTCCIHPKRRYAFIIIIGIFFINYSILHAIKNIHMWRSDIFPFLIGNSSYASIYKKHGLLSDDAVKVRNLLGPEERIISSNPMQQSYAIPFLSMEVELNYSYRDWHTMVFADPKHAKKAFSKEGINYFYFDFDYIVNGMIPFSPLFKTKSILSNLKVIWHNNNAYLLTWKDNSRFNSKKLRIHLNKNSVPIELTFAKQLTAILANKPDQRKMYDRVELYWRLNKKNENPNYRRTLPPLVR